MDFPRDARTLFLAHTLQTCRQHAQLFARALESTLCSFAFGDVAQDRADPVCRAARMQQRKFHRQMHVHAVGLRDLLLEVNALARLKDLAVVGAVCVGERSLEKLPIRATYGEGAWDSRDLLEAPVDDDITALYVLERHRGNGMVDEGAQAGFALLHHAVCAIPLYCEGSQVARHAHKAEVERRGRTGPAVVHRERAQDLSRPRAD